MKNFLNFILINLLWLSCIFGAANQVIWPSVLILIMMIVLYFTTKLSHPTDSTYVFYSVILGFILDSFMAITGLIQYHYNFGINFLAPIWILFLWVGFALTFNHSMSWMFKNQKLGYAIIGVGSPLSYYSAYKLNAIEIYNLPLTFIVVSFLWLVTFKIFFHIQNSQTQKEVYQHV